jgi:hypothetical protein
MNDMASTLSDRYGNEIVRGVYFYFPNKKGVETDLFYIEPQQDGSIVAGNGERVSRITNNPRDFARDLIPIANSGRKMSYILSKLERV